MLRNALAVAIVVLLSSSGAMAQQGRIAKACAEDIKAQCAEVQPGEGRIRACIKEHVKDLSEPCRTALTEAATIHKACKGDVKQFCADVKRGGGRIIACVKSHLDEVSEPCKDALTQAAAGAK